MMGLFDEGEVSYLPENDFRAGNQRSLIRKIGSNLPLSSTQRPRFELLPTGPRLINEVQRPIFSLSDVYQLVDISDMFPTSLPGSSAASADVKDADAAPTEDVKPELPTPSIPQADVANKISALEDELSLLRSQIAMLVSNQNKPEHNVNVSLAFNSSASGEPFSCSTPIKPMQPPPSPFIPPPPPPPPPPPAMAPPIDTRISVSDLIKQRRQNKGQDVKPSTKRPLSMSDVLKDLHKVKLKSVTRSPGGTPMGNKKPPRPADPSDPAAFIAEALRKKFAHRSNNASESPELGLRKVTTILEKEWEDSPPKFGQHLLKKRSPLSKVPTL